MTTAAALEPVVQDPIPAPLPGEDVEAYRDRLARWAAAQNPGVRLTRSRWEALCYVAGIEPY